MSSPLDPYIVASKGLVSSNAQRLCRRQGFRPDEQADIEQDLWTHLSARVVEFDPAVGDWPPWATAILENECVSIWRQRNAAMRDPGREEFSLDDLVQNADGELVTRAETTPEASHDPTVARDLRLDMAEVIARQPEERRPVLLLLAAGSPYGVGLALEIPRRTMPKLMDEGRESLRDAGMDGYLA